MYSHQWAQPGEGKKTPRITKNYALSLWFSFLLSSVSEGMEEVMQTWGMVASVSGHLYMCSVFSLRDFNTLGRKGDLVLNWRAAYLKEPRCMMEGGKGALRSCTLRGQGPQPKPGHTWQQQPELPPHALWDALQHQLPCFFCAVHADPLPILSKVNLPSLLLQKFFGLKQIMKHYCVPKHFKDGKERLNGKSEYLP